MGVREGIQGKSIDIPGEAFSTINDEDKNGVERWEGGIDDEPDV